MKRASLVLAFALIFLGASAAQAAIAIQISNATIPAGGSGFIDVTLTVDQNVALFDYSLRFQLDQPYPPSNSSLMFVEFAPLGYENDVNPDYVLLGHSTNLAGDVPGAATTGLDWFVSDIADTDATLLPGVTYLLARVKVQHDDNPQVNSVGDTFRLDLVLGVDTFFEDSDLNTIPIDTVSQGIITITNAAQVPEPASWLVLSFMLSLAWPLRPRRWVN